jgi:hypothetical protein
MRSKAILKIGLPLTFVAIVIFAAIKGSSQSDFEIVGSSEPCSNKISFAEAGFPNRVIRRYSLNISFDVACKAVATEISDPTVTLAIMYAVWAK